MFCVRLGLALLRGSSSSAYNSVDNFVVGQVIELEEHAVFNLTLEAHLY